MQRMMLTEPRSVRTILLVLLRKHRRQEGQALHEVDLVNGDSRGIRAVRACVN
jgi:hypothetical protein